MYRQDAHPRDLPVDPDDILAAQRRLRRKQLLAVGGALLVLGVAGGGTAVFLSRRAEAVRARAWERAAVCVVGTGEDAPSVRARNAQLVAMGVSPEKRHTPGFDGWPDRCVAPLHALAEAAKESGAEGVAEASEKAATALAAPSSLSADLGPPIDRLFAAAAAERLPRDLPASVVPEPARAAPMALATLPKEARMFAEQIPLTSIHRSALADEQPRFVVDDVAFKRGPAVCDFTDTRRAVVCAKVPAPAAAMSPALRLWGTTGPAVKPFVFAGDRGKSGVFRSDTGARVVDRLEYGAYGATALDDGSFGYLVWNETPPETHFVHVAADGSRAESPVVGRRESGNPYYTTSIFWSHVVYKSVRPGAPGIRLMVREIDPPGTLGSLVDVGRIAETGQIEGGESEEPHLTGCRAGGTTVIRAKGWNDTYLSFLVDGRWTAPVEARGLGGRIECRPGEAIVSRVWGGEAASGFHGGVDLFHCTVSGCDDRSFRIDALLANDKDTLPREARDVRVADIDGKVLLVWSAGTRGGLRARFGAPGELASLPDTVLYDDHVRDGALREESTLVDFDLVPSAHGALLLLGTIDGVYALFFDATGKPAPVSTTL